MYMCYKTQLERNQKVVILSICHHSLCESKNLIGSLGIGYLLIDHGPIHVAFQRENVS